MVVITDSMADYLAFALAGASPELICPDALADLAALGKKLPPGFGAFLFGFECRLGGEDSSVDFFTALTAAGLSKETISRIIIEEIVDHPLFHIHAGADQAWEKLRVLINGYLGNDPVLSKNLKIIILEFDQATAADNHPAPGVFLGPRSHSSATENELQENAIWRTASGAPAAYRTVVRGLEMAGGNKLPAETRKTLRRIYRQLTLPAVIFQAGAMLSRNPAAVKICIGDIDRAQISSFLKSAGWPGNYQTLEHFIEIWGGIFDKFVLSLDVSGDILPRVGIECYFHQKKQPHQEKRWQALVEHLMGEGVCTPGKGEGLLAFTARQQFFPRPVFEDAPNSPSRLPRRLFVSARGLNHLKFMIEPKKNISVKAYLWAWVKPMA